MLRTGHRKPQCLNSYFLLREGKGIEPQRDIIGLLMVSSKRQKFEGGPDVWPLLAQATGAVHSLSSQGAILATRRGEQLSYRSPFFRGVATSRKTQ